MTFYNVVSALLFLGTLRVLLLGFETSNWPNVFASGCLAVLVFNDMLATSHEVEVKQKIKYEMPLMLIDLVNFVIIGMAIIVISPAKNLLDVELPKVASTLGRNSFWLFLLAYWIFLMIWTAIAVKQQKKTQTTNDICRQFVVAGVLGTAWLVHKLGSAWVAFITEVLVFAYLFCHMTLLRKLFGETTPAT